MAGQSSKGNQKQADAERAPLLGVRATEDGKGSEENGKDAEAAVPVKAVRWVARHAVIVCMSLLILAVIIVLCLFFGSKQNSFLMVYMRD